VGQISLERESLKLTIERRIIVGLDDIKALCIECLGCSTRVALLPGKIKEIPESCQYCGHKWRPKRGTSFEATKISAFESLVLSISKIRTTIEGEGEEELTGFKISFEFEEPS